MSKEVELPGIGKVLLTKRRTSRHIRLRVSHDGTPHVSMPIWLSYKQALLFVSTKTEWITKQQETHAPAFLIDGQRIGKSHKLSFIHQNIQKPRTRISGNQAIVTIPTSLETESKTAQHAAERVAIKVLKLEAETLLSQRLNQLATKHDLPYSEVKIGKMRSRWGSCNSHKLITLNCYLIQLPWHLIDYVILHELAHTKVMAHNDSFWSLLEELTPNVKQLRKELKSYHTQILRAD